MTSLKKRKGLQWMELNLGFNRLHAAFTFSLQPLACKPDHLYNLFRHRQQPLT
jgi:hypothetical protein